MSTTRYNYSVHSFNMTPSTISQNVSIPSLAVSHLSQLALEEVPMPMIPIMSVVMLGNSMCIDCKSKKMYS